MQEIKQANQIKVQYVSKWDEGFVYLKAALDLNTGILVDVEQTTEGDDYESHIEDVVMIGLLDDGFKFLVQDDRVIDLAALTTLRQKARFEVLTNGENVFEHNSFVSCNGVPVFFETLEDARKYTEEFLLDVVAAVATGSMQDEYNPSDYQIRKIATHECFEIGWSKSEPEKLELIGSDLIVAFDDDQPTRCPDCGGNTDFEEISCSRQRHSCLNLACSNVFFAEPMDIDNEAKSIFSVMIMADGENQTFTWCGKAANPNEAIELALTSMNLGRCESEISSDILGESEISVLFVAEGEVKYRCAPGDIDEDRFYLHP